MQCSILIIAMACNMLGAMLIVLQEETGRKYTVGTKVWHKTWVIAIKSQHHLKHVLTAETLFV
jgi:hypothetical protein